MNEGEMVTSGYFLNEGQAVVSQATIGRAADNRSYRYEFVSRKRARKCACLRYASRYFTGGCDDDLDVIDE